MKRLFLLSMAFVGTVVLTFVLVVGVAEYLGEEVSDALAMFFGILVLLFGGAGSITLGVMLVKHIRDIFKT